MTRQALAPSFSRMSQRRTQFDPAGSMRSRPFERMLLRHGFIHEAIVCLARMGFTAMIWPRFVAPFRWRLTRYPMAFPNLPQAFEGYRILHLTDLHVGRARMRFLRSAIGRALAEKPDLVVITGDLIDYSKKGLELLPELLRGLVAPDGVVAIFGNHDYHEYSWRHVGQRSRHRAIQKRLVRVVQEAGIRLLRNENLAIGRGGGQLKIVGMDEMWAEDFRPDDAFEGIAAEDSCLCLQHNPDGYEVLQRYPWQWMLCGHTHGGQVNPPLLGPMYVPMEHPEWLRGFHVFDTPAGGRRVMFVSNGIGYSTPIRMRVPPEITLFTLKRGEPEASAAQA